MIAVLYDPRAETVTRAGLEDEAPANHDASAILVVDGRLKVCGWFWMAYPPGDAVDIAEAMMDCAPPGFFTAEEFCEIVSAIEGARS